MTLKLYKHKETGEEVIAETLFEDEDGPFWWRQCVKPKCPNYVCKRYSDKFCYPHSKWYRPITRHINGFVDWLQDLFGTN